MLLPTLLLVAAALPAPVTGGAQFAVSPDGVDLLTSYVEGERYEVDLAQVGGAYSCWDELGILDFNLDIPVETVDVALEQGQLRVQVTFGTIQGQDMVVYGVDEDYFDVCPEFDSELLYVTIEDPTFEVVLQPSVSDGQLWLGVVGTPVVSGDLDMDIDWFPDDLVLAFYEETFFEEVAEAARTYIPEAVATFFDAEMLSGTVDDYALRASLTDVAVDSSALAVGLDLETTWLGEAACTPGAGGDGKGREPSLDLTPGRSSLAIGVTEAQLNETFQRLQSEGFFCFGADRMDLVYEGLADLFDPSVAGLEASASLAHAPVLTLDAGGGTALFQGVTLDVRGTLDGRAVDLLSLEGDLSARIDVGLEPALTSLTLSLHDLSLDIRSLEADHLLSDSATASDHLASFLETWAAGWAEEQVQDMALFTAQYHLYGTWLRVDRVEYATGGLEVFLSLFDEDDPAVDKVAPDTSAQVGSTNPGEGTATASWSGTDDRGGALGYAWRVDGGGWSSFTLDEGVVLEDLSPGEHWLEVKARDGWLNEDPTPASTPFRLSGTGGNGEGGDGGETGGCGCAAGAKGATGGAAWAALAGIGLALRRRSRRRA